MNSSSVTRDHPLRAGAIVEQAAEHSAERRGDGEHDAEQAKLYGAPAEHRRGIDAAEGEHRAQPVGVEHAREQEERDLAVMAHELLDRARELGEPGPHRARFDRLCGAVRREEKQRNDEDEIPERREGTDQAVALARRRIERHDGRTSRAASCRYADRRRGGPRPAPG